MADSGRTYVRMGPPEARTRLRGSYVSTAEDWTAWLDFAGVMMILLGAFQATAGLVALLREDYFLVARDRLVVDVSYTAWGWVHLGIGALAVAAGIGVILHQAWARIVGILLAAASALVNLGFIAAYPIWAMIMIAFDVTVIYALVVHGARRPGGAGRHASR